MPFLPSCAPGTANDFLILLTLLKNVRCSELGRRRCLKLVQFDWVLVPLQIFENRS